MTTERYAWKEIPGSSHDLLRRQIRALPPGRRLLDLGAAGGHLGRAVRDRCAYLAGVEPDPALPPACREGYDDWRATDALSAGTWDAPFDVVVCADVLEHLPRPEELLARIREWLAPGGVALRLAAQRRQRHRAGGAPARPVLLRREGNPRPDAPALLHAALGARAARERGLPRPEHRRHRHALRARAARPRPRAAGRTRARVRERLGAALADDVRIPVRDGRRCGS